MTMVLSRAECERLSLVPGKTTVIIATCQSRIECLMWSVFSLLLRSTSEMEHVIVAINGPDSRTGDPTLQDNKQAFLEELRSLKWGSRDMPITISRTWSRVGHSQAIDSVLAWVHTEGYTLMHDDIIITNPNWCKFTFEALADKKVGMVYAPPLLASGLSPVDFEGSRKLNLPHPNTMFLTSRKELYVSQGVRWYGYHVKDNYDLYFKVNRDGFLNFHGKDVTHLPPDGCYGYISMDVGTWPYYKLKENEYKLVPLPDNSVTHLTAMSWRDDNGQNQSINRNKLVIDKLKEEILDNPVFGRLYNKYVNV